MPKNKTDKSNQILFIVAHPDDEIIGAGGAIFRHVAKGDQVSVLFMTDGESSRVYNKKHIAKRISAAQKVSKYLGFKWFKNGNFPDNAMDTVPLLSVIKVIEEAKDSINPSIVYTHSQADLNIDHRIVFEATMTAFRPQPKEFLKEIRLFEIASSTDYGQSSINGSFNPNLYISLNSNILKKKLKALSFYDKEMNKPPHSRSYEGIQNLLELRGNQCGHKYAEAFQIIRKII